MISSKDLKSLVAQNLITQEQAEKIMLMEQTKKLSLFWKILFGISASLIGLGIILIIGSNWDAIPNVIKLFFNFSIFAASLYGTYWSIIQQKKTPYRNVFSPFIFNDCSLNWTDCTNL